MFVHASDHHLTKTGHITLMADKLCTIMTPHSLRRTFILFYEDQSDVT